MFNGGSHLYSLTYFIRINRLYLKKKKNLKMLYLIKKATSKYPLLKKKWLSIKTIKYPDITRQSYITNRHVRSFAVSLIKYIAKNVFNYANSRSSVDYSRPPVDICKHNGCTVNHPRPANQRIHSLLKRFTTCCPDVFATRLFFPNRGHGDISWRHGRSS